MVFTRHNTQINCVPTIARLAKGCALELYTYFGIDLEALGIPNFPSLTITSIFCGVTFNDLPPAIECSRLFDTDLQTFMTKGHKRNVCDLLLQINPHACSQNELPEHELTNLRRLNVLKDICANLSKKHFDDAIHLWHAELGQMQYFLSADCKFITAVRQKKNLSLHCQLVSPAELLDALCIVERDPWPFDPEQLYTLDGRPVR